MSFASRFFLHRLKATRATANFSAFAERAAASSGLKNTRSVEVYLIQSTRPIAYLVRRWGHSEVYLSKVLVAECTNEQLQNLFLRLLNELQKHPIRIGLGSYFIAAGWKFESFSLARFESTASAYGNLGFFRLLRTLLLLPLWRLSWNLSQSNRHWLERSLSPKA